MLLPFWGVRAAAQSYDPTVASWLTCTPVPKYHEANQSQLSLWFLRLQLGPPLTWLLWPKITTWPSWTLNYGSSLFKYQIHTVPSLLLFLSQTLLSPLSYAPRSFLTRRTYLPSLLLNNLQRQLPSLGSITKLLSCLRLWARLAQLQLWTLLMPRLRHRPGVLDQLLTLLLVSQLSGRRIKVSISSPYSSCNLPDAGTH